MEGFREELIADKLDSIERRFQELGELLTRPEVVSDVSLLQKLAQERSDIEELVSRYQEYKALGQTLQETRGMLEEGLEPEMEELARQEIEGLQARRGGLLEKIRLALLPRDPNDMKDIIVEIRAGAGGDEAGLFAADLFRMYSRYAEEKGWRLEIMSKNESGIGAFKEMIFEVKGRGAYSRLKYESGVHRVQRVPVTEAGGRIHTSTATVAVLPRAEEVEVEIREENLRIDIFHSGGAGGQNVNKVATAVRITHLPTGMVVTCQDERSQLKNRLKATAVLRARLYQMEQEKQAVEVAQSRRLQVGTGERAEKVRTYNFPQDRVTDHRIGISWHNLPRILDGHLDPILDAVGTADQAERLRHELALPVGQKS